MSINKIKITNFKCFNGTFEIVLNEGLNLLVGNNETGKSTIMEAIQIALTGLYCGRSIRNELSQYLFNNDVVNNYIESVNAGTPLPPPSICIEVYFGISIDPSYEGNDNSDKDSCEGLKFEIVFNDNYLEEYNSLISSKDILSLPIEYYDINWSSFARQSITARSIPIKSVMIDSSNYRYQNGSDVYISRIVKDLLSPEEIVSVSQAHRKMRESFIDDRSIKEINNRIEKEASLIDGAVSLTVDLGTKNAWENTLVTQLDSVPFDYIGRGAQCVMKTELALTNKNSQQAQIILLEEPESHLSFSKLNQLIKAIEDMYESKQIIISTHSSFVANKLGLENLLLLDNKKVVKMGDLKSNDFFRKIAGYDTLRLILCKKAILVEGDSDELVVQKAYMIKNGRLPIQDQIDVISVGTSFLRFLEIANLLKKNTVVVTDNDGDIDAIEKKYTNYIKGNKKENIKICYDDVVDEGNLQIKDKDYNYNTLEPKLLKANNNNVKLFNSILSTHFNKVEDLQKYMRSNKTEVALAIFNTNENIVFPEYILRAINDE